MDFANMAGPSGHSSWRPSENRKSMTWATYMSNMVLLEESEPKIPSSPDYTVCDSRQTGSDPYGDTGSWAVSLGAS